MSDPNRLSAPTNSLEKIRTAAKSKYGKFAVGAAGAFAAAGLLSACETASANPDNTVKTEQVDPTTSETAAPTQSAEIITADELLPNVEAVRATLDETRFQIPYRDNYTADELAELSMNQTFDIREMFQGNTKLLVDDFHEWFNVQFEEKSEAADYQTYARALTEVEVAVAKDNILSPDYSDSLKTGDFDYIKTTLEISGYSIVLNQMKAESQDVPYDATGEVQKGSATINYQDNNGEVHLSYISTEAFTALNDNPGGSAKTKADITYVNVDGILMMKTVSFTDL